MAHALLPKIAGRLAGVKLQQIEKRVNLIKGCEADVFELSNKFATLEEKMKDAERKKYTVNPIWDWLEQLEDIVYEIEDLLEEWRMKIVETSDLHQAAHVKAGKGMVEKVRSSKPSHGSYTKPVLERDDFGKKIKEINLKIGLVLGRADVLDQVSDNPRVVGANTPNPLDRVSDMTTSIFDISQVHGREFDRDSLLNHLLEESKTRASGRVGNHRMKVISLVGAGGSGKTTLARFIYNNDEVIKHFVPRKWIVVADSFDEKRISDTLLGDEVTADKLPLPNSELESKSQHVQNPFSGKKFLLVLDDVWIDESSKWKLFRATLEDCAPGSIILVTTRSERVARAIGSDSFALGTISTYACGLMLKEIACSGRPEFWKKVEKVGWKIAKICNGLPLAAKIMGNHLRHKNTKKDWEEAMQHEMWQIDEMKNHPLFSRYKRLSPRLKCCFSLCGIFPRNTVINVEQLIRLWIAQGYLDPLSGESDDDKAKEARGIGYIHELAQRSLLQELVKSYVHKDKLTGCKMDEVVHDFARFTANRYLAKLGKIKTSYDEALEHRKMRTFVYISHPQVPKDLFGYLIYARALVLTSCQLEELPTEMGKLIHLQYLDLSGNLLNQLPEAICDLRNLQFLDVHFCYVLVSLPHRVGDLKQLRHLRSNYTTDELQKFPEGIEKLTLIRTIDVFRVGGRYNDIKKLSNLDGLEEIRIVVHGDVKFEDAELQKKDMMENLEFCFLGEGCNHEKASSLEKLQPPPKLQTLMFEDYPGLEMPKWIVDVSLINNLKRLSLRSAFNIQFFPTLWQLSSLEFLWLCDIPNLKYLGREFFGLHKTVQLKKEDQKTWSYPKGHSHIGPDDEEIIELSEDEAEEMTKEVKAFPNLKTFRIENMDNWETWEELNADDDILVMPRLEELIINHCPKIGALPLFIGEKTSLKVEVESCSKLKHYLNKKKKEMVGPRM